MVIFICSAFLCLQETAFAMEVGEGAGGTGGAVQAPPIQPQQPFPLVINNEIHIAPPQVGVGSVGVVGGSSAKSSVIFLANK
jgi:hypothetical protein